MLTILFFGKSGTIQSLSVGKRRVVPIGESLREVFGRRCSRLSSQVYPCFLLVGLRIFLLNFAASSTPINHSCFSAYSTNTSRLDYFRVSVYARRYRYQARSVSAVS